jgi:uncharacterized repeat protein (TIGR03803 family)
MQKDMLIPDEMKVPMKTSLKSFFLLPVLITGFGLILTGRVTAQTFTTLHSFIGGLDGADPQAGLTSLGNVLYGATDSGGSSDIGAVFALNSDGTGFTTLHDFTAGPGFSSPDSVNSDGAYPDGTLILSGDTLYGTAYWGGTSGKGTIFKVNTDGAGFTVLHSFAIGSGSFPFNYVNSDGTCPEVGLVLSGNTLYGTTEKGGISGLGAVFAVNTDGIGFTNLHSFNGSDGDVPEGVLLSGNTLYGVTIGGYSGKGTVFKVNTDGTGFTTLHSFTAYSSLGLVLYGDTLYGTTYAGGTWGSGTVFAVKTNGTGFTTLHDFTITSGPLHVNSDGAAPSGQLTRSGNTLYGTTYAGGSAGNGTVFAIQTDGTGFTNLHSFAATFSGVNSDGANPYAGLLLSGDTLYGTAKYGGRSGHGTVFSLSFGAVSTPQLTIIRSGTNVVLTWPINATGFALQSTTNLVSPAVWTTNFPTPVVVNGQNTVTNPITGRQQFFRLIQ